MFNIPDLFFGLQFPQTMLKLSALTNGVININLSFELYKL